MSRHRWRFDGTTFGIAAELFRCRRLPYPLSFTAPHYVSYEDYQRARAEAGRQLAWNADEPMAEALSVLFAPRYRIEMHGTVRGNEIRLHAALRHEVAVLAWQEPGLDAGADRSVTVDLCARSDVIERIVAALPAYRVGDGSAARFRASDLAADREVLADPIRESPADELRRLFHRRRDGVGEIAAFRGPDPGSGPEAGTSVHWLDYPADGRYLLRHRCHDSEITPATPRALLDAVSGLLAAAQ